MKHIKSYKIFESFVEFSEKVKEDIEDIFRELDLVGIKFTIRDGFFRKKTIIRSDGIQSYTSLYINITENGNLSFKDVEDCILRLPDYFKTLPDKYDVRITSMRINDYYSISEFISKYEHYNFPNIEVIIIKYD